MDMARNYKYDNLKALLIFLVVFGHVLESVPGEYRRIIYLTIYTFHMPMFIYISGYFSKTTVKNTTSYIYIYIYHMANVLPAYRQIHSAPVRKL